MPPVRVNNSRLSRLGTLGLTLGYLPSIAIFFKRSSVAKSKDSETLASGLSDCFSIRCLASEIVSPLGSSFFKKSITAWRISALIVTPFAPARRVIALLFNFDSTYDTRSVPSRNLFGIFFSLLVSCCLTRCLFRPSVKLGYYLRHHFCTGVQSFFVFFLWDSFRRIKVKSFTTLKRYLFSWQIGEPHRG